MSGATSMRKYRAALRRQFKLVQPDGRLLVLEHSIMNLIALMHAGDVERIEIVTGFGELDLVQVKIDTSEPVPPRGELHTHVSTKGPPLTRWLYGTARRSSSVMEVILCGPDGGQE